MNPDPNLMPADPRVQPSAPIQPQPITAPGITTQPEVKFDSTVPQQAPAPQPMFSPTTPPMPGQPMPVQAPMPAQSQPVFTPMAASQMPNRGFNKKILIVIGAVVAFIAIVAVAVLVFSKAALIGSLSPDSYEGVNYQRPTSWTKDTSGSGYISYHPTNSVGKGSDGKPTYALKMNISAQKNIFGSSPDKLSPSDKATLLATIDKEVTDASSEILPSKSEIGCDTAPIYKDKPKKVDIPNAFIAIKYSLTCSSGTGSTMTTFYYTIIDVVPNDKDVEYIMNIGAASKNTYDTNLVKADKIIGSISF